jgi:hypothetical protein
MLNNKTKKNYMLKKEKEKNNNQTRASLSNLS